MQNKNTNLKNFLFLSTLETSFLAEPTRPDNTIGNFIKNNVTIQTEEDPAEDFLTNATSQDLDIFCWNKSVRVWMLHAFWSYCDWLCLDWSCLIGFIGWLKNLTLWRYLRNCKKKSETEVLLEWATKNRNPWVLVSKLIYQLFYQSLRPKVNFPCFHTFKLVISYWISRDPLHLMNRSF